MRSSVANFNKSWLRRDHTQNYKERRAMILRQLAWILAGVIFLGPVSAHHNFAAHYDRSSTTSVEGIVKEFLFTNPHCRIYLEVVNEAGDTEDWLIEGDSRSILGRSGWTGTELTPGDMIRVFGWPSRDGLNRVHWLTITTSGSELQGELARLVEAAERRREQLRK